MAGTEAAARPIFVSEGEVLPPHHRGLWADAWHRLLKNRFALAAVVILAVVVTVAFSAPYVQAIERYDPSDITTEKQLSPSRDHWFGTDQLGRDMWARTLEGVRISIKIGLGTAVVALVVGLFFGVLAAIGGRTTDTLVMRFTDIMFSFPDVLLIILLREILIGRDIPFMTDTMVLVLAIGFIAWTTVARLVRGQMLSLSERDFVMAARALGASRQRVVTQHMLPNTLGPVIVAITFAIPVAIFAEAALSFIGLGIPPPASSLGSLVSDGYRYIQRNVWTVIFPAAAVSLLMLCFTFLGDGLRDALDPRTRGSV